MARLPKINGARIKGGALPAFTWNADLIAFDGPFLSLFKSDTGVDALFIWLDANDRVNRWGIVDVQRDALSAYLTQQLSLRQILEQSTSITIFSMGDSGKRSNIFQTDFQRFPAEYLPADDSFLLDRISTKEAKRLASEKTSPYEIGLDGELYLDDLAAIPRAYQQLYSFHYGLEHLERLAIQDEVRELMKRWSGGFSAVNLFTGLRNVTPSIHRAKLVALDYHSPGTITLDLLPNLASRIASVVTKLTSNVDAFGATEDLYKQTYTYFREQRISGFDDANRAKDAYLTDEQTADLGKLASRFLDSLGLETYGDHFAKLQLGPLPKLRALLAYYRRLRRIVEYVSQGIVSLPT